MMTTIDSVSYGSVKTISTIAASCSTQELIAADDAEQLATLLKAIADPARLRLLSLIQAQPDHEACVCHFTGAWLSASPRSATT